MPRIPAHLHHRQRRSDRKGKWGRGFKKGASTENKRTPKDSGGPLGYAGSELEPKGPIRDSEKAQITKKQLLGDSGGLSETQNDSLETQVGLGLLRSLPLKMFH